MSVQPADLIMYDTEEHPTERFHVTDDSSASWAMRKLAGLRAKIAEVNQIADAERERIGAWESERVADLTRDADYFVGLLVEYARHEREHGDRKSIALPYGTVKSRAGGQRVEFADEAAFLAWAQKNSPTLVRVRVEPDRSAIKACLSGEGDTVVDTTTGEVVPGVMMARSETTYTVETHNP